LHHREYRLFLKVEVEDEVEVKVKVKVEDVDEVDVEDVDEVDVEDVDEVENSPQISQILCKQSGRAERTQIISMIE
jgi:hypothetical protein